MLRLILMSRPAWLSYGFYLLNSVLPKDNADRYSPKLHLGRRMLLAFIPFDTLLPVDTGNQKFKYRSDRAYVNSRVHRLYGYSEAPTNFSHLRYAFSILSYGRRSACL